MRPRHHNGMLPVRQGAAMPGVVTTMGSRRALVLSTGDAGDVQVWDLASGRTVRRSFKSRAGGVVGAAVATLRGRPVAVTCGDGGAVDVWDVSRSWLPARRYAGHSRPHTVWSVAVGELQGRPVVVSAGAEAIHVWDLATRTTIAVRPGVNFMLAAGTMDASDPQFWLPTWDLTHACLRDGRTGEPIDTRSWDLHAGPVYCLSAGALHGRPVTVSAGADGTVRVWELSTCTPIGGPYLGHDDSVRTVALGEVNGRPAAVSAGTDTTVQVWDLETRESLHDPLRGHEAIVWSVALGEMNGEPVAVSGSSDATVRVWSLVTGQQVGRPYSEHGGSVSCVAVGELGGRAVAVSADVDGAIHGWDLATRQRIGSPLRAHEDGVGHLVVFEH
jgi:WD40 repeat protein